MLYLLSVCTSNQSPYVNGGHLSSSPSHIPSFLIFLNATYLPPSPLIPPFPTNLPNSPIATITMSSGQQTGDHNQRSALDQQHISTSGVWSDSGYGSVSGETSVEQNAPVQIFPGPATAACKFFLQYPNVSSNESLNIHSSAESERRQWSSHLHQLY